MLIEPHSDADLDAILAINNANTPAVGPLDETSLSTLVSRSALVLVAHPDDDPSTVAGFCVLLEPGTSYGSVNYRWFGERYDDFWYLDRVAVDAPHRGQGVGAALYEEVERRCNASMIALEVNLRPRNDGSLAFHRRMGFDEVGQQETDYGFLVSMQTKPLFP